jgi:hypothetical protein
LPKSRSESIGVQHGVTDVTAYKKEQAYSELSDGIDVKKCLQDKMDPLEKRNKEDLREEVKHLKRH